MPANPRTDGVASDAPPIDNTARAYREVRSAILSGTLKPGAWVSQVGLAAELEISRTPLREALRLLETEGLVESAFNRRVRVSGLSIEDLESLYAMRLGTEPLAVRLSVPHLSDNELGELRGAMHSMNASNPLDPSVIAATHRRFHVGLFAHVGERFRRHVEDLWDHAERYRTLYQEDDKHRAALIAVAIEEHELIMQAAEGRDGALCGSRVAGHLARSALTIIAKVDGGHDPHTIREALAQIVDTRSTHLVVTRARSESGPVGLELFY